VHRRAVSRGDRAHDARRRVAQLRGSPALLSASALVVALAFVAAACAPGVPTSTMVPAPGSTTTTALTGTTAGTLPVSTTETPTGDTSTTAAGPPVIKIGALFPLTGDLASEGQSALKGMRLAVEEVNAAGGIVSLGGARLTLAESDSKGDAATADTEVARLVQKEGVAAIVGTGQSTVALNATDAAERLQVPFIVASGAADEITERSLRYTLRLCPKADWYARDQVAFLTTLKDGKGADITAVALLHAKGDFGKHTAESQKAYLAKAGIDVVADIEYAPDQADLQSEILTIRKSGAQAVLTATVLSDAVVIADYAAVLHLGLPVIDAAGGVLAPGFIEDAGAAGELTMSVAEAAPGLRPSRSLEQRLAASGTTLDADLLYGYQSVWVLASALERAGSAEGPALCLALHTTALYGEHLVLPQDLLMFDAAGQNWGARLLVVQVQNGAMVTVWPQEYAQGATRRPA
jgi:branched-chain amino acid transport system substrate-binding protein